MSSSVRNHQEESDLNSLADHSMTVSCQYAVAVKKGKCVSEVEYGDISREDKKALVSPSNTRGLEAHVPIKRKMNYNWKQYSWYINIKKTPK